MNVITLTKNQSLPNNQNPILRRKILKQHSPLKTNDVNLWHLLDKKKENDEILAGLQVDQEISEWESRKKFKTRPIPPLTPIQFTSEEKYLLQQLEKPDITEIWDGYEIEPQTMPTSPVQKRIEEKKLKAKSALASLPHSQKCSPHGTRQNSPRYNHPNSSTYHQSPPNPKKWTNPPSWTLLDEPISLSRPPIVTNTNKYNSKPFIRITHDHKNGIPTYSRREKIYHEYQIEKYNEYVRNARTVDNKKKENALKKRVQNNIETQRQKRLDHRQKENSLGQDWAQRKIQDKFLEQLRKQQAVKDIITEEEIEMLKSLNEADQRMKDLEITKRCARQEEDYLESMS